MPQVLSLTKFLPTQKSLIPNFHLIKKKLFVSNSEKLLKVSQKPQHKNSSFLRSSKPKICQTSKQRHKLNCCSFKAHFFCLSKGVSWVKISLPSKYSHQIMHNFRKRSSKIHQSSQSAVDTIILYSLSYNRWLMLPESKTQFSKQHRAFLTKPSLTCAVDCGGR